MPGHRFVEGHHFGVPSGAGGGPLGVEPERPRPAAVEAGRGVVRRGAAHGNNLRHGRDLARRRKWLGEELPRPRLGPPHGRGRLAYGLIGGNLPVGVPQGGEDLIQPGKPQAGAQLHGAGLQRRDVVQAGLVQFFGGHRQRGVDADRPCVVRLPAGQVRQASPLGRPGLREQFPDRGHPPRQRGVHHLFGGRAALFLPCRCRLPPLRWAGGEHRADAGVGQDPLGPGDRLLGQRGDRQPPLASPGPEPLSDLVEPGAAAAQPGQVGLGRGRVDQDRPGRHREEGRRARVLHRGDGVLRPGQIDALLFRRSRLLGAVERDGLGRRELPAGDHIGFFEEPPDLGAPGSPALLALVRDQVVVPRDAVHRGGERVLFQPAPVHPVGQLTR
jgi:hypothetical protein